MKSWLKQLNDGAKLETGSVTRVAGVKGVVKDLKQNDPESLTINLPFPPSVNHYLGRHGYRSYKTPKAKVFDSEVYAIVLTSKANKNYDVPVKVWYQYWFPDRRRRDVANYEKVLSDALVTAGVMLDDHLIYDIRQTKMGFCPEGKVKVIIAPYVSDFIPA